MGDFQDWYEGTTRKIEQHKVRLSADDQQKYNTDELTRAAKRIADYSGDCETCRSLRGVVDDLVSSLGKAYQFTSDEQREYGRKYDSLTEHIREQHKRVRRGYYSAIWLSTGLCLGVCMGIVLDELLLGISGGIALGLAFGASLDAKAKKEGKSI